MDNQDIAALVPAAHDANVGVLRVENQIARLRFSPGNCCAVSMLCASAPAVAYGVGPIGDIVKYPIHKTGAVEAVGPVGSGCAAAVCPYL